MSADENRQQPREWRKRILVLLIGLVFAFGVFELLLAGFSSMHALKPQSQGGEKQFTILVVGNSYTKGDGAKVGFAYGDILERLLRERHPRLNARVINGGVSLGTTSLLLERLPEQLKTYQPDVVAMMVGDPNFVFNYGFERFQQRRLPQTAFGKALLVVKDILYSSRVVRWVSFFRGGFYDRQASNWGPLQWLALVEDVSYNPRWLDHERALMAYASLEKYFASHPDDKYVAVALMQLSGLLKNQEHWARWLGEVRRIAPKDFLYLPYSQTKKKIQSGNFTGADLELQKKRLKELSLNFPGEKEFREIDRSQLFGHSQTKPYLPAGLSPEQECEYIARMIVHNPLNVRHYATLAGCYRRLGDEHRAAEVMMRAAERNPYSQHGPVEYLLNLQYTTKVEAVKREIQAFTQNFFEKNPEFRYLSYVRTSPEKKAWVRSDVSDMISMIRMRGIPVVMQSYPPLRDGFIRVIDRLVPELAKEFQVPLSDTHARLKSLYTSVEEKESYYSNEFGTEDHHLNAKGNAVVAETLYETLRENKLIDDAALP